MKTTHRLLLLCPTLFLIAPAIAQERLGTVDFPVSCSPCEAAGNLPDAKHYYAALQAMTGDGAQSLRPELTHAKSLQ